MKKTSTGTHIQHFEIVLCRNRVVMLSNFLPCCIETEFDKYRVMRGAPIYLDNKFTEW